MNKTYVQVLTCTCALRKKLNFMAAFKKKGRVTFPVVGQQQHLSAGDQTDQKVTSKSKN